MSTRTSLDRAIQTRRDELRHRLGATGSPLPANLLGDLAALVLARSGEVERMLREDVDRPTRRNEGEVFHADPVTPPREQAVVETELAEITAELERRADEAELGRIEEQRKGLLERIGGRR